jgi:hypothetical protein
MGVAVVSKLDTRGSSLVELRDPVCQAMHVGTQLVLDQVKRNAVEPTASRLSLTLDVRLGGAGQPLRFGGVPPLAGGAGGHHGSNRRGPEQACG